MDSSDLPRLLEGDVFGVPRRYVVSAAIVCAVKLLLATLLFFVAGIDTNGGFWMDAGRVAPLIQNEVLWKNVDDAPSWVYIFLGWDSAWYASIAAYGYGFSVHSIAFMPGYPLLGWVLQSILGGVLPSLAVVSLFAGVLWVPVFESVAEHYVGKREALLGSLFFAFSPFTLLFTTVAYSEGFFLLLTLAAWCLYLNGRYTTASVAAALVALVRIPGFLIVLPMAMGLLVSRQGGARRALLVASPTVLVLLGWVGVNWLLTGEPVALLKNTEWSGMYTLPTWLARVLPAGGSSVLAFPVPFLDLHPLIPVAAWISIIILPTIVYMLRRIDWSLTVYCGAYLTGVLAFGAVVSFPRFVAVLFPLWLPLMTRLPRKWSFATLTTMSVALSLVLWAGFLGGLFVG